MKSLLLVCRDLWIGLRIRRSSARHPHHPSRLILLPSDASASETKRGSGGGGVAIDPWLRTSRKAGQVAIGPEHAMAGCDDRDWIAAVGCADRTRGVGPANLSRDLAVAAGFTERDRQQRLPDALLEVGALEIQRHREFLQFATEIGFQLALGLDDELVV